MADQTDVPFSVPVKTCPDGKPTYDFERFDREWQEYQKQEQVAAQGGEMFELRSQTHNGVGKER